MATTLRQDGEHQSRERLAAAPRRPVLGDWAMAGMGRVATAGIQLSYDLGMAQQVLNDGDALPAERLFEKRFVPWATETEILGQSADVAVLPAAPTTSPR